MITITLNQIKSKKPCESGWDCVLAANGGDGADYNKPFPLSDILDTNGLDDTLWALRCLPEHDHLWRKFAVWCARNVQHLLTDKRSVRALDVAWRHSEGLATNAELTVSWVEVWVPVWETPKTQEAAATAAAAAAWTTQANAGEGAARAAAAAAVARATGPEAEQEQEKKLREILTAGEWVDDKSDKRREGI